MRHNKDKTKHTNYEQTQFAILFIIGLCHLLNDSLQAVIPAMFPILEKSLGLTFTQLGLIAFTLNMTASIMQPMIGLYTDKHPMPFALPIGLMSSTLGMLGLALAPNFAVILISVFFIGLGSATFHPEGSRVAYMASGSRRGLAQSIFQVGGNMGQSLAPIITAIILVPLGQFGAIWFTLIASIAVILLFYIATWSKQQLTHIKNGTKKLPRSVQLVTKDKVRNAIIVLVLILFIRSWYHSAISNFYAFFAIEKFGISIAGAQVYIFTFLFMGAVGTFLGGPLSDKFGKRNIILLSLIGPAPLTLLLPYTNAIGSLILVFFIGFLILSSFSVAVVYAQELVPGKIGLMSGITVGLAFGMGAIGSVALGSIIDWIGLTTTMQLVAFLPLLGVLAFLLPSDKTVSSWYKTER